MPITPTPDQAARTARHLAACAELIELGLRHARTATARIEADNAEPDAQTPATTPEPPTLAFARAARVVHQAIALESRIAAEAREAANPTPKRRTIPPYDPRRANLRAAIHISTETRPDRTEIRADAMDRIEQILAADPDHLIHLAAALDLVVDDLEITPDFEQMPNELLDAIAANEPPLEPPPQPPPPNPPPYWHPP